MKINDTLKAILFILALMMVVPFAKAGTITTITYQSTTQNTSCKMNVYTPSGYEQAADSINSYPVFYLIHGGGENYTHWANSGDAKATLDDFISKGKAVPMIVVMPDAKNLDAEVFTKELINNIMPYIEKNYRVKADKDHRGVGGLSWGGLQAMDAGIYHYESFGYLSVLSSGWFATDQNAYTKAKNFLSVHAKDMENSIRYLYFGEGTSTDIAYNNGLATLKVFRDSGLTVHYWEHPGGHTWQTWREDLKSFLPYLFRDSTTKYVSLEFMGGNIVNSTIMTHIGSLIEEPQTPTRTGYTFAGWYKEAACITSFDFAHDTIKKNTTIYAKWNINSYKIIFNSNGGSAVNDTITAEFNSLIKTPAAPVKAGFVFDGWYTSISYTKKWNFASDKVSKDMTLVAKWVDSAMVSIGNFDKTNIVIFPNPANSELKISNLPSSATISVFNLEGKLMVMKNVEDSNATLNIDALTQGVYQVKISNSDFSYSQNMVIKR